jgi:threonine/homoserine/homoserine lactone efflux protein
MWSFVLASFVLVMIPGPDQALMTRNALAGGRPAGMLTMVGGALGLTIHASAASLGVSALLLASATAFTILKVVGTIYLIWMGIQTLRAARRSRRSAEVEPVVRRRGSALRYVRQGFLSNSLNPKVALFFVTLLPQFMSPDDSALRRGLVLSGVFAVIYVSWFSLYVLTVDLFGRLLRRPRVKAAIERVTGLLLVAFAVRLVTETN